MFCEKTLKSTKNIAIIPPSGSFIHQDLFFDKFIYFLKQQKITYSILLIQNSIKREYQDENEIFFQNIEELIYFLKHETFDLIFHRCWMHRYEFAGKLAKEINNIVFYIKDWMEEIPREKYKFLYETDDDYDGIKDMFHHGKLILSHYSDEYMHTIAKIYHVPSKKFHFFPEYCIEEKFIKRSFIYNKKNIRILWVGGIVHTSSPNEISANKTFFETFQYITKQNKNITVDMFLLKYMYEKIHNPANKLIWQDWLFEDKFNDKFNIKLGSSTDLNIFLNYDFAIISNLWFDKNDLSLLNTAHAVISKFALYLEIGIPIIVHEKWKPLVDIVKQYDIGIIISNKDIKKLDTILSISKSRYDTIVENIYKFRKLYTYNKQTMQVILK